MNVPIRVASEGPSRRAFSVNDVRRMVKAGILAENESVELIDGELVRMAAKGFSHEIMKSALVARLNRALSEEFFVGIESSLQLADDVLVEPDILVCRRDSLTPSKETFITVQSPSVLLLVEIAVSSMAYDRGRKALLYARHAISEYWVIDGNRRTTWVHSGPTPDGYQAIKEIEGRRQLRPADPALQNIRFRLADIA